MKLSEVSTRRLARGRATVYVPPFFQGEEDCIIELRGGCGARICSKSLDAAIIAAMICTEWEEADGGLEDLWRTMVQDLSVSPGGGEAGQ